MRCCVCKVLGEVLLGGEEYLPLKTVRGRKGTDCRPVGPEGLGLGRREQVGYQEHGKKFRVQLSAEQIF